MNLPNAISFGRLLVLTPMFVVALLVLDDPLLALALLIVLGITDWADGYIARRFDLVTELGKKIDPVADRVSQLTVCVSLVVAGLVPLWMAVVLFIADLVLGIVVLIARPGIVTVRWFGKLRTALLMIGFPLLLLVEWIAPAPSVPATAVLVLVGAGVVLHALANLQYALVTIAGARSRSATHRIG